MKLQLLLCLCLIPFWNGAQKLVKSLDRSSDFSTNVFYFFDDSTFTYFRGGCTYLNVTMGSWYQEKKDYHLIPNQSFKPEIFVIKQTVSDTCDRLFEVQFLDASNQLIPCDWTLIDRTQNVPTDNHERMNAVDQWQRYTVMGIDSNFRPVKRACDDYELLPITIFRAFNMQELIPVDPNVNFMQVQVKIPREIARFLLFGNFHYSTMNGTEFTFKKERFIIDD